MLRVCVGGVGVASAAARVSSKPSMVCMTMQRLSKRGLDPVASSARTSAFPTITNAGGRAMTTSSRGAFMLAARRTTAVPSPPAVLFLPVRLKNAFQPQTNAVVRHTGNNGIGHARHHQVSYRTQMFHSRRHRSFELSGDTVVLGLISTNVVVTMMWLTAHSQRKKRRMMAHFTTSALHLARGQYHTLLTSVFSHADPGHLLANMVGLYFFGRQIGNVLGPKRFLALYLGSGVLSSWAAVYEQQYSDRFSFNLGASGAVNSITALSILLFPHSTLLIFGILPMPAWLFGSMFIFKDAYSWATDRRDGIGHFAHLSGAFCGGAYYYYLRRHGGLRFFR